MKNNICILLFLVFIIFSCNQKNENSIKKCNKEEEVEIIANTISSCIGWFKEKDFELLYSIVAQDSNYISVHPTNNIIRGYDEFVKSSEIFKNPDFIYVRHELKNLKITLSNTGDLAWFYCILDDINTYKGEPACWENARWTGVLEKRNNKWIIVQQHFSFASK